MRYPKHADSRTHQYFTCGFVGAGHGDVLDHECAEDLENGTACSKCVRGGSARSSRLTMFDSMCGLPSTSTVTTSRGTHYCVYCGNLAHTLQDRRQRASHHVTGHTCTCSGACDEREFTAKWNEMTNRHHKEEDELRKQVPRRNQEVLQKLWIAEHERTLKDIEDGLCPLILEKVGIIVRDDPIDN